MQIHVVQPGQSLFGIAQSFNTSVASIANANELSNPARLVVGQALVIPIVGRFHWVQQGQSLYTISQMYGLSVAELARINAIPASSAIQVGLRLYIPPQPKTTIDVMVYAEPRTQQEVEALTNELRGKSNYVSYLGIFSYRANRDGTLDSPDPGNIPTIASAAGIRATLVISNLEEYQFSADLAHELFTNDVAANRLFANAIQIAHRLGYTDIHFDFELLRPEDRELYNAFLRNARDSFQAAGLFISSALGPKTKPTKTSIYGAHDYAAIGNIVNLASLMTYEWGYMYSSPQAISPIGAVRAVAEYALSKMPKQKILLGQNLYGYDWTAPYPPQGGAPAKAVSSKQAIELALRENVVIQYDQLAQAPFFRYTDDAGRLHEVWFEDARSIQAKFDLVKQLNLRGMMYWKLGLSFPQNWLLLSDNFNIRKSV